jgi:hypothetical protein
MGKFLIGVATAALWFALSHAANAAQVCRQVCDNGTCVSKCVDHPDPTMIVRDHDNDSDRDHPAPGPGVDVQAPGVGVQIGR